MKTPLLSVLLLSFLTTFTFAEVVPWMVVTGRGPGNLEGAPVSYTVPAGKVFVIEAVQHRTGGAVREGDFYQVQTFQQPANRSNRVTIYIELGPWKNWQVDRLPAPLHLSAGEGVGSNQASGHTFWWGKLMDAGDLFAKLDVELDDSSVDGDKLKAVAKVSPTRPYRLTVESATQLSQFDADPGATVASTDESMKKEIAVDPTVGGNLKFVRAVAVARPAR